MPVLAQSDLAAQAFNHFLDVSLPVQILATALVVALVVGIGLWFAGRNSARQLKILEDTTSNSLTQTQALAAQTVQLERHGDALRQIPGLMTSHTEALKTVTQTLTAIDARIVTGFQANATLLDTSLAAQSLDLNVKADTRHLALIALVQATDTHIGQLEALLKDVRALIEKDIKELAP